MNTYMSDVYLASDVELQKVGDYDLAKFRVRARPVNPEKDKTIWWDCEAWGKTAELAGRFLKDKSRINIRAEVKQEEWTTKDGQKREKKALRVDRFNLLDPKPEGNAAPQAQPQEASEPAPQSTGTEDDIPF